ncbi:hypothetical protein DPMN_093742 [Dreissena polymorpha]|uniref:Uncharacterized protein n=1 Tax=Dreissena polymorpha TaxID=45954 RepID=A0A9D4L640_DREPO|nr:hypothetical protein DPMN_093742 [Dreissena polymorpha]
MHLTDHSSRSTPSDSLQRSQDRLGTCARLPYSLRRCQTVSQTCRTRAGDFQTVCDGAKTVSQTGEAPARDSFEVCDGTKTIWPPA